MYGSGYFLSVFAALCGNFANAGYIIITIILFLTAFAAFLQACLQNSDIILSAELFAMLIAAVSFFIQNVNIYLLLAAMAVLVWLIPGFILRAHFKKQHHG